MPFSLVTRKEWGALPPLAEINKLEKPAKLLFIYRTLTKRCTDKKTCMKSVQNMQKYDMEDGCPDIVYNFLIGGDNTVYEGRGWDYVGIPIRGGSVDKSRRKLDIAFIGTFRDSQFSLPPDPMMDAASSLVDYGIQEKLIHPKVKYEFVDDGPPRWEEDYNHLSNIAEVEIEDPEYIWM